MQLIALTAWDLVLAAVLVCGVAALSLRMRLELERPILVAGARAVVQLLLVGWILRAVFDAVALGWVALVAAGMLLAAGRESRARQQRPLIGVWSYAVGTGAMFVSSFAVAVAALVWIIGPEPWYAPQYAIPLLGMLLGNTLTGVSLAMDRLTQAAFDERSIIEQRLMLGQDHVEAVRGISREALRQGMIPIVNAMAAAGIVSLPGMMTGQILAGAPPLEAVRYQILILFLISGGTGLGTLLAVRLTARRLFDSRQRLRLDRLRAASAR